MIQWMFIAVIMVLAAAPAQAQWRFEWSRDPGTGEPSCLAVSPAQIVKTGSGNVESSVRLAVLGDGSITLLSDPVPFLPFASNTIWLQVDDKAVFVFLKPSEDKRSVSFSEEDSIALHHQFEEGAKVTANVVFGPQGTAARTTFSLEGYPGVAAQYKGCRGLLLSEGWPGIFMNPMPKDPAWLTWVIGNTPYHKPGIQIVTIDPRKEANRIGLRPGDIIVGFQGQAAEVGPMIRAMKDLEPGKTMELDIVRDRALVKKVLVRPAPKNSE